MSGSAVDSGTRSGMLRSRPSEYLVVDREQAMATDVWLFRNANRLPRRSIVSREGSRKMPTVRVSVLRCHSRQFAELSRK